MKRYSLVWFSVLVLLLSACQSTAGGGGSDSAIEGGRDYVFTFLLSGERVDEADADEIQQASTGHFANMSRLAEEKLLVMAGPLGPPRANPNYRGIFVFDVRTVEEGGALTATDPAVKAGLLAMDNYPFRTAEPLARILELEAEVRANATPEEAAAPEFNVRPYVLLTASPAGAAAEVMQPLLAAGRVFVHGEFGGSMADTALFCLDAADVDQARAMLPDMALPGQPIEWQLHPWFSSRAVEQLRR